MIPNYINNLKTYAIVDENDEIVEYFRLKQSATNYLHALIKDNKNLIQLNKYKIVKLK